MLIKNLADAQRILQQRATLSLGAHDPDVPTRMSKIMQHVDNPQDRLKIIHIAGTSGKTSTAYFLSALLTIAGRRVGMSISPYTYVLNERLQLNGRMLSERQFCTELGKFMDLLDAFDSPLRYLELLTAFAYWELDQLQVEYAVIEANAGGRYDATNIATHADKLCVITDIGYDHTDILGTKLSQITANKAGIIHRGNMALIHSQELGIVRIVDNRCRRVGAELAVVREEPRGTIGNALLELPPFSQRNWWLAWQAYQLLARQDRLPELSAKQRKDTMHITIPGRMERVKVGGTDLIFDVAHNAQKMAALVEALLRQHAQQPIVMLVMLGEQKDAQAILRTLVPMQPQVICTEYSYIQGLPHQARKAAQLADHAKTVGLRDITIEPDNKAALRKLLTSPRQLKVITGTVYGLAQVRDLIGG